MDAREHFAIFYHFCCWVDLSKKKFGIAKCVLFFAEKIRTFSNVSLKEPKKKRIWLSVAGMMLCKNIEETYIFAGRNIFLAQVYTKLNVKIVKYFSNLFNYDIFWRKQNMAMCQHKQNSINYFLSAISHSCNVDNRKTLLPKYLNIFGSANERLFNCQMWWQNNRNVCFLEQYLSMTNVWKKMVMCE